MKYNKAEEGVRERLLVAGIKELENHGFNDFSLRRVASLCNVSCAAPYKHFKNKEDLLSALMDYTNSSWHLLRDQVLEIYKDAGIGKKLVELSVAYLSFLQATPSYMTVLTMRSDENKMIDGLRAQLSHPILELVDEYLGDDPRLDGLKRKMVYSVRSYIYGTVCMIRNKEVDKKEETIEMFRSILNRVMINAENAAEKIKSGNEDTDEIYL